MGGLARRIPITFVTFAIATGAIAGLPPLAGFFSKDEILWFAYASGRGGSAWLFALAAATALLTAIYMFRLLWLTFFGKSRMDAATEHHVHESPWSMTGILIVLAALSTVGGFIPVPHYLEPMLPLPSITPGTCSASHSPIVVASIVIAFAGSCACGIAVRRPLAIGRADTRPVCCPLSGPFGQVLHRRDLRGTDRASALLDFRPRIAADRRPRLDRRITALDCRAGPNYSAAALGAIANRPTALLRVPCARRNRRFARLGLAPWLKPLAERGLVPAIDRHRGDDRDAGACRCRSVKAVSLATMVLQFVLVAWLYTRFDPFGAGTAV